MLEQPFYFFAAAFFAATTYIGLDVGFTFTTVFGPSNPSSSLNSITLFVLTSIWPGAYVLSPSSQSLLSPFPRYPRFFSRVPTPKVKRIPLLTPVLTRQSRAALSRDHDVRRAGHAQRSAPNVVLCPRRRPLRALPARLLPPQQGHLQGAHPLIPSLCPRSRFTHSLPHCSFRSFAGTSGAQGAASKVDGSFIATLLETAAVGVLYMAWRSITEGAYPVHSPQRSLLLPSPFPFLSFLALILVSSHPCSRLVSFHPRLIFIAPSPPLASPRASRSLTPRLCRIVGGRGVLPAVTALAGLAPSTRVASAVARSTLPTVRLYDTHDSPTTPCPSCTRAHAPAGPRACVRSFSLFIFFLVLDGPLRFSPVLGSYLAGLISSPCHVYRTGRARPCRSLLRVCVPLIVYRPPRCCPLSCFVPAGRK